MTFVICDFLSFSFAEMEKQVCKAKSPIVYSAVTEVKTAPNLFKWSIKNFSLCSQKLGECLVSPTFPSWGNISWQIKCFPRGDCEKRKNILCVCLHLVSAPMTLSKSPKIAVEFKLSIVKASEKQCHIATSEKIHIFTVGQNWGLELMQRDILLNPKYEYLPDDTLTLGCHVATVFETVVFTDIPEDLDLPKSGNQQLSDDLEFLLCNSKFSDVIFCVCGTEYPAHRNILSARSSVLKKMFEDDKEQKNFVRIEISDITPTIFKLILRFIYTGKMEDLEENAEALLPATHRFALFQLKCSCEDVLCSQLSIENAVSYLILSDLCCAHRLKKVAITFVTSNASQLTSTEQWKAMTKSHPNLLSEAFDKLIQVQAALFS